MTFRPHHPRLAVAVPTVPARRELALKLVANHLPGSTMVLEDGSGLWHNARAAWRATVAMGRPWCMVIQDDVSPVPGFLCYVEAAIEDRPTDILNLFCSRGRDMDQARGAGASWIEYDTVCFGQAIVMPREVAMDFLAWAELHTSPAWNMDDQRIALYACLEGRRLYSTAPSLMQHAEELRSTWANRDGSNLQSSQVGPWQPGPTFRPHQRGVASFVETKTRRWIL